MLHSLLLQIGYHGYTVKQLILFLCHHQRTEYCSGHVRLSVDVCLITHLCHKVDVHTAPVLMYI